MQTVASAVTSAMPRSAPEGERAPHARARSRPAGGARFDWAMAVFSAWLVGGAFLDNWAHTHGRVDATFFTPWHAVLYTAMLAVGMFLVVTQVGNVARGYAWRAALPPGYGRSLLGVALFAAGGAGDLVWHTLFGVEVDVEALLSPTHLLLALGALLIVTGPLRAAWHRVGTPGAAAQRWAASRSIPQALPMVISLALLLSLLSGLTQFAHPAVDLWAARNPRRPPVVVNTEIYAMRADGSGQTRLAFNRDGTQAEYIDPAWSPDGRRLAFASGPPGANQLYVMNADGSDRRRLTEGEGNPGRPAWSPDGRLAFQSRRSGNSEIYVLNADGSGFANPTNLTNHPADDLLATWSPDGGRLAFTSNRDGRWQIYAMNADGSGQTRLTHTAAFDVLGAWSPDGQQIAFHSNRDGNWEIYVMNADGSEQTRLTRNDALDYLPAWSPDGRRLAFASNRDGNFEVYVMNADGSEQTNLTNHPAMEDGEIGISWSPDGGTLAFSSRGRPPAEVPLWIRQALGAASVLIQSSLLVGVVLLALRAGPLPFGAFALVFTLNMALISVIHDQYRLIPTAPVAGLAADALARQLQPGAARPDALRLFAFAVPAIYYALYFLTLQVTQGIGWSIHLWLGTVALAGATGVLLTCLLPRSQPLGA